MFGGLIFLGTWWLVSLLWNQALCSHLSTLRKQTSKLVLFIIMEMLLGDFTNVKWQMLNPLVYSITKGSNENLLPHGNVTRNYIRSVVESPSVVRYTDCCSKTTFVLKKYLSFISPINQANLASLNSGECCRCLHWRYNFTFTQEPEYDMPWAPTSSSK